MVAASAQSYSIAVKDAPKLGISWQDFAKKYLQKEDKYKYEWVNGQVEKTLRTMDTSQFYIQNNLINFLYQLKTLMPINGNLMVEGDTFFGKNHRRPDLAFYTNEQIAAARHRENVVPKFVVEVISTNDQIIKVAQKMREYRAAGVEIIWLIFPDAEEIHVYRGLSSVVCSGNDICSAEPIIEGYRISAKEIFA